MLDRNQILLQNKDKIDEIFKPENLNAILAVMNTLVPIEYCKIAEDEFKTVTNLAKYQGATEIITKLTEFIIHERK